MAKQLTQPEKQKENETRKTTTGINNQHSYKQRTTKQTQTTSNAVNNHKKQQATAIRTQQQQ